ncbi:hypothetical protein NUW54_g112 [Trametes sanguinea]|uniref:Uncharacterized protein n=1 Tax=Trametes sanguinea TaxID=158606 RepID=A0ACC1QAN2_9APHY|nr:hypothetical protein NUW54_g112 [Trametes sanguinea]
MRDWRRYLRRFVRIAGWLQGQNKLSDNDYAYYLWTGLTSSFRRRLEARLLLKDPHHDMSKPFDPTDIQKAAEALLGVDRFDTERLGSGEWSENESDRVSDDFPEISVPKSRKHARGHQSSDDESDFSEEDSRRSAPQEYRHAPDRITGGETLRKAEGKRKFEDEKEFNQLVDQMQNLSLDDPKYGFLYLKVCAMKPMAAECLPKPKVNNAAAPLKGVIRDVPPHMAPNSYDRNLQSRPQRTDNHGCYGCGDSSHIMNNCPIIDEYLRKGYIARDNSGRIVQPDGSPLQRQFNENWVQAAKRIMPTVNFVSYGGPAVETAEESDVEECVEDAEVLVYPVERSQRETRSYRKQVFDGVKAPQLDKGKQREGNTAQRTTGAPSRYPMQRLTPVETQQPTFNPDNDAEMIDDRARPTQPQSAVIPQAQTTSNRSRMPVRRSQLNQEVDSEAILNKILDSQLTLSVREVVGVSKDVAGRLQDVLKVKRAEFVPPPATNLVTTHTGALICVEVECNHRPVSFIVDTGSQLNIISEEICKKIVRRPINTEEAITMNDANGGSKNLLGLVEDIPLKFGHIKTPINAYVAKEPPFSGLLGRPWQRAHKIGIEEREDGTYLTFPAPRGSAKCELLVSPMVDNGPIPGVYSAIVQQWTPDNAKIPTVEEVDEDEYADLPDLQDVDSDDDDEMDSGDDQAYATCEETEATEETPCSDTEDDNGEDSDGSSEDYHLDHVLGLLSYRNADEVPDHAERQTYHRVWQQLQDDVPDIPAVRAGPCTIMTGTSAEFAATGRGLENRVFLLRDAKLFNRGGGCFGHMIVKVVPYVDDDLAIFTQLEDDTLRTDTISMISATDLGAAKSNSGILVSGTPAPPPLIKVPLRVNGYTIPFLLDTGAQVNCIRADVWKKVRGAGGMLNARPARTILASATGELMKCIGVWGTEVEFGNLVMKVDFMIIDSMTSVGILGRPWQKQGHMWMEETPEGVYMGISTCDRSRSYGMLISSPHDQNVICTEPLVAAVRPRSEEKLPVIDYSETHKLQELMNQGETSSSIAPEVGTEPTDTRFRLTNPVSWIPDWKLRKWKHIFERLQHLYYHVFKHTRTTVQPQLTGISFDRAEKLELRRRWKMHLTPNEECYLLQNVQVEVDGNVRWGHGVLQIAYFPPIYQEPGRQSHDTSINLSESSTQEHPKYPQPTMQDLEESMEEIANEATCSTRTQPPARRRNSISHVESRTRWTGYTVADDVEGDAQPQNFGPLARFFTDSRSDVGRAY